MEARNISNLIFRLLGAFLIYSLLFKYTLGAVFEINELSIYQEFTYGFSLNLSVFFTIVFSFIIFIKNPNILTYLLYKNNYYIELNVPNQKHILKIIFLSFSIIGLSIFFFVVKGVDFLDRLQSSVLIISLIILIFHRYFIKFMIRHINLNSAPQSSHVFIFSMFSILFYFLFFLDYGFSLSGFYFTLHFGILSIAIFSPLFFKHFVQKDISITNSQFTILLFFWILFLFNLQNFLLNFTDNEKDIPYLIKNLILRIAVPLFFLFFFKFFDKFKIPSILQFSFTILGVLLIFCPIIRYLNGTSYSMYLYLIVGILILFLSRKTIFFDKKIEKLKFKNLERNIEPSMQNNSSFILISLLLFTFSKLIIPSIYLKLNLDSLISLSILMIETIIIGKLALRKKINLDNFITLIVICTSMLILWNYLLWVINSRVFYNDFLGRIDILEIFILIVLIITIIFSSHIAKLIKLVLPKNH